MSVLIISCLLLGSLLLIRPDKLEPRLSVCLSLFLFAISFNFTIEPPAVYQARATLGETLTFFLLMGAGLLSVLSVIERTVFEARPNFVILQYPMEGFVLSLLSFALYSQLAYLSGLVRPYPTMQYHPYMPSFLSPQSSMDTSPKPFYSWLSGCERRVRARLQ
jgi:hypothetical protein